MKYRTSILVIFLSVLYGCGAENVLTKKEMAIQSKANLIVANTLFDNDMNDKASYHFSKKGTVTIKSPLLHH